MPSAADPSEAVRRALQARVDAALRETPDLHLGSGYAEFGPPDDMDAITRRLTHIAGNHQVGPADGEDHAEARMVAVLDECAQLAADDAVDPIALRRALASMIVHHPAATALGLRLPDLASSAPWLARPSRR